MSIANKIFLRRLALETKLRPGEWDILFGVFGDGEICDERFQANPKKAVIWALEQLRDDKHGWTSLGALEDGWNALVKIPMVMRFLAKDPHFILLHDN